MGQADQIHHQIKMINKMRLKHLIILLTIPLSEIKAIFYNSDLKVSWYLFSDHKRYLCNVLEDYANTIIFLILFGYVAFFKLDQITKNIFAYLFFLNILDIFHLGFLDMQYLVIAKLLLAYGIYYLWSKLRHSY
jgi:hypothetical protein